MGKSLNFYSTSSDIKDVMSAIEQSIEFRIVESRGDVNGVAVSWDTYHEIPDFGISKTGNQALNPIFLLVPKSEIINPRRVKLRKGGFNYFVDQSVVPASVTLHVGGEFENSCIIAGMLATISEDEWSIDAYNTIARIFRKSFTKFHEYYVGYQAMQRMAEGTRLTPGVGFNPICDLNNRE